MEKLKFVILGAGGSIANAFTDELLNNGYQVKLASRKEIKKNNCNWVKTDLLDFNQTLNAVKGSDIAVLTAGLKYDKKVWQAEWPLLINNVIDACKQEKVKLIFFDNVYMYGRVAGKMTEETPYNPCSKKGEVRARIAKMLESEYQRGNLDILIARAADLYGPYGGLNCIPNFMIIENLLKGKKAQILGKDNVFHSYTFIPDCAKSLYILANDPTAFNQIWHLPTATPAITGKQFVGYTAELLGVSARYTILSKFMVKLAGLFNTTINEVGEMLYQNLYDYYFDSSKFEQKYNFTPTSYGKGILETINYYKKNSAK